MLVMLVIQYGLGIILNLYVEVPASDAHAGILSEIATAPPVLTVHAILGIALIGTAILLVARAVGVRDRLLAVLATAGLTAIGGAFGTGEIFVRDGQDTASMAMAILTGMALLCYIGTLTLATAAGREDGGPRRVRRAPGFTPQRRPSAGPSADHRADHRAGRPARESGALPGRMARLAGRDHGLLVPAGVSGGWNGSRSRRGPGPGR